MIIRRSPVHAYRFFRPPCAVPNLCPHAARTHCTHLHTTSPHTCTQLHTVARTATCLHKSHKVARAPQTNARDLNMHDCRSASRRGTAAASSSSSISFVPRHFGPSSPLIYHPRRHPPSQLASHQASQPLWLTRRSPTPAGPHLSITPMSLGGGRLPICGRPSDAATGAVWRPVVPQASQPLHHYASAPLHHCTTGPPPPGGLSTGGPR